jgi:N6-L-threonylcarbamoyladenine synthase/protein kinase Bud32
VRVLGIEGTAWAASAAVFETDADGSASASGATEDGPPPRFGDPERDALFVDSDPYEPESGGIHPREAAEHMADAVPRVVERALSTARQWAAEAGESETAPPVDAVAFSRGPGLGPCLRVVGTAARALAGTLDVPLVGVNHMVAHLEVGRYFSGFDAPVCLNASGANAHLLGFHDGRYRVLGETMDTGVGNALDKFARHVGWSHPGGPKVERAAAEGEYVDLPYVVKGMDFSFSGLSSAAQALVDEGERVEDVCRGLEETVFAMLTEVSERALSLTGTDELVLGGGVGQNGRLRSMLAEMCEARGAAFFAPDAQYLRDNAAMIAVLGARMFAAGDVVSVADSAVDPEFRPDEVPVTWRVGGSVVSDDAGDPFVRGAEATVSVADDRVVKRRVAKPYRHPALDERLRRERTVAEARLTSEARRHGVPTPLVLDVDTAAATLTLQRVGDRDLAVAPSPARAGAVGRHLGRLHAAGIVHGDPTPRNVRVTGPAGSADGADGGRRADPSGGGAGGGTAADADDSGGRVPDGDGDGDVDRVYLIDFGLGSHSGHVEDHAMDLHVFAGALRGTADDPEDLVAAFEAGYRGTGPEGVIDRLRDVEGRGRYR